MAAAGSIGAGVARTKGAAPMRDNSAMATTNLRAYAFLRGVGDMRVPSRRSAGLTRGRTRIMSDLLNHLVGRLSDALPWVSVLNKPRPARVKESDRDHRPAAGLLPWSRANKPSARVRHDAASPPRPCAS